MKKLASILILSSVLITSTVFAAPYKDGFNVMDIKSTESSTKEWTINFSKQVDNSLAISNNIYITDEDNKKIATKVELLNDKSKVKVTPLINYQINKEYRLYIEDNLKVIGQNIYLKRAEVMPFKYVSSNQEEYIKNIRVDYNSMVSNIIVVCNTEVFKVMINGKPAHYDGNYIYSLGIASLDRNNSLEIKVYNDKDILLEAKIHKI